MWWENNCKWKTWIKLVEGDSADTLGAFIDGELCILEEKINLAEEKVEVENEKY